MSAMGSDVEPTNSDCGFVLASLVLGTGDDEIDPCRLRLFIGDMSSLMIIPSSSESESRILSRTFLFVAVCLSCRSGGLELMISTPSP